ncbi:complement C1r-A subcomponent-like isoform X2 [Silurus meridionalis]|uniref:Complement subcomponent C1r n=1 Tax=Silurus meridionalis TaxID=175797 RepID=A0A8T0BMR4_SILME|nr:complement C1r-A subcomponent-like isoform X2 [Silurus meridionalis]KAF7708399.1 hypothetical protein HF521_017456 [Silurus meridionalis]
MARLQQILSVLCICVSVCVCKVSMRGQVQSPLYPKPYPTSVNQQWDLEVPHGYQFQFTFYHLDIEPSFNCVNDSLMVLHGKKLLGKFCGQNSTYPHHPGNNPILFKSNHLQLVFVTDLSNTETHFGFSAVYQAVVDCNRGVFTEPKGVLLSPGYPNAAPLGVNCLYIISVKPGFQISLNFSDDFRIMKVHAEEPSCSIHWLELSVPGKTSKKLCGDNSPGVIHTGSHTVYLGFHTDPWMKGGGFRLHYTTQRVECKIEGGIPNGRVTLGSCDTEYKLYTVSNTGETPKNLSGEDCKIEGGICKNKHTHYLPKYCYRDYIEVHCDTGYKLTMGENEIKSYKSLCQENGTWHLPLPECKIIDCGEPKSLLNGGFKYLANSKNEYMSVIQYHCNEPFYAFKDTNKINFTCDADRKWRGYDDDIIPRCFPVCGRPVVDIAGGHGRVLGGQKAVDNSFPWQVYLLVEGGGRGGAIVIGEKWLLTAAHMFNKDNLSKDELKTFVGSNKVSDYFESNTSFKALPIESFHIHPGYKRPDYNNDIALIKLASSLTFNAGVMPVCLPAQDSGLQNSGWVSGFGITERYRTANHLRYITLPIVDQEVCCFSFEEVKKTGGNVSNLTENMFCAGLPEGGKDTCQGDAGSGFVTKKNDVFYVAGIVSWGVECGRPGRYGVYTRVARYTNWIQKIMEEP